MIYQIQDNTGLVNYHTWYVWVQQSTEPRESGVEQEKIVRRGQIIN